MVGQQALRDAARQVLPRPIGRALRRTETFGRRVLSWVDVARYARGVEAADRAVLRRALMGSPASMLSDLDQWREPALESDAEVEVKGLGRFAIRGKSDDLGHALPTNFGDVFAAVRSHVKAGDVAIDAGSNIGAVAICMAACVGSNGRVIAVEMMPDTARQLRKNVALNGLTQVAVVEQALSQAAGETVTATVVPGMFGQASIVGGLSGQRQSIEVETTTLDCITDGIPDIALMKLDLEGAEPQALLGATNMLKRVRAIIFESWDGGEGCETTALLREAGFAIASLDGRNFLATQQHRGA